MTDGNREVLHRARRIETRVTRIAEALGIPTQADKPKFLISERNGKPQGRMILASRFASLKEILDNVPETWEGPFGVFVGDDLIATIDGLGNRL